VAEDTESDPLGDLIVWLDGSIDPELEQAPSELTAPRSLSYDLHAVMLEHFVHCERVGSRPAGRASAELPSSKQHTGSRTGWVLGISDNGTWQVDVTPPTSSTTYEFVSKTWGPNGSKLDRHERVASAEQAGEQSRRERRRPAPAGPATPDRLSCP
jgi:hypothetical protein